MIRGVDPKHIVKSQREMEQNIKAHDHVVQRIINLSNIAPIPDKFQTAKFNKVSKTGYDPKHLIKRVRIKSQSNKSALTEMIKSDKTVIADIWVDKEENCFPMIQSGSAHNEMLLNKDQKQDQKSAEKGKVLV